MAFLVGWDYRRRLTVDNTKIEGGSNLTDFTIYVKLDNTNFDFSKALTNGFDIRFTASDETTLLKFERVRHDSVGEIAEYNVKIPSVFYSADTDFYIYYGNAGAGDDEDAINTYDANTKGVWHLNDITSNTIEDSTSNNNDGTKTGANEPNEVSTILGGKGQDFDGVDDHIDCGNNGSWEVDAGDFTLSTWASYDHPAGSSSYNIITGGGSNDYGFWIIIMFSNGGSPETRIIGGVSDGSGFISIEYTLYSEYNDLHRYTLVREGNTLRFYMDGIQVDTADITGVGNLNSPNNRPYTFGDWQIESTGAWDNFYVHDGKIDETKLSHIVRTPEWIKAEYYSDKDELLTYGSEESATTEFCDLVSDIRAKHTEDFVDIDSDIRARKTIFKDIDTDIRIVSRNFIDISADIRVVNRPVTAQVQVNKLYLEEGYYLSATAVTIILDVAGALRMRFSNDNSGIWSAWEDYADIKSWTLSVGDGAKKIFCQFLDIQGDLTDGFDVLEAVLNTSTPPAVIIEAYTNQGAGTSILPSVYQTDTTPYFRWGIPIYNASFEGFSFEMDDVPNNIMNIPVGSKVRDGILVSKGAGLVFDIAAGNFYYENIIKPPYAGGNVTFSIGGVQDRIDVIYIDGIDTIVKVIEGIEAASPTVPIIPPEGISLAQVYVPAGAPDNSTMILTDVRKLYIELIKYLTEPLQPGQHVLQVKGYCENGLWSNISTFNIWVANDNPIMGEIKCYTHAGGFELTNGLYQIIDNTPYFEWTVALAEPGPIRYYYTEDGSEPDAGDSFVITNNYTPGVYSNGITELKVKPYDTTTGYWGEAKSFIFIYGTQTFTDDTAVISGSTLLKQSLKEVHVKEITWDFNSARICRIFQPVAFDADLPFSDGDIITVVYGSSNTVLFRGRILQVERTIDIGQEGVTYHCSGPRQELAEEYAYVDNVDFGETAQIIFEDISITSAIDQIVSKFPEAVKSVSSYPTGVNITDQFVGQVASQVLEGLYARTKYGWYIKPDGTLVSIDLTATSAGQAKFGVYGTTVHPTSPQYNVMASNLQFDITNRYNKCIIEGARKQERITVSARCGLPAVLLNQLEQDDRNNYNRFKVFHIDSKWPVVKIIETWISYARLKSFFIIPAGLFPGEVHHWMYFLEYSICKDNIITTTKKSTTSKVSDSDFGFGKYQEFTGTKPEGITHETEAQGTLGADNTIRFAREMYSFWPGGSIQVGKAMGCIYRDPAKACATCRADIIIETVPLKVEVIVSGSADTYAKTLRIVNKEFRYNEDPDDTVDDTARMTQYAQDLLQKYKDVKVNGSITLDTIDLDWDLDKTVNLINTAQASWSSLNAKVIGITYDFDANTTTLEITSEYLK